MITAAAVASTCKPASAFAVGPLNHDHSNEYKVRSRPHPLPRTNNALALLGFDWLSPPPDFDVIHKAYKALAKQYHPDAAVGPDATVEERREASLEFSRINAAYEQLKKKEEEEVIDYTVFIDGKQVVQSVVINSDNYRNDPHRVNYDRIVSMAKYRELFPKEQMWYEKKHDYQPRNNGEFAP